MGKHTSGPWKFYHSPPYIGVSGHDDYCVHEEKQHSGSDLEIQIANSKLMAAAPDLLDALQMSNEIILRLISGKKINNLDEAIAYNQSIIKSATETQ